MVVTEKCERVAEFVKTDRNLAALREHLECVVNGDAFRGSRRSAQFLSFIVEKAIKNQIDVLKERTIGVELFGRAPTYDTGEDAIVRVTATDVRRRLLQHYGRIREASEFRINLPTGGYIPEIECQNASLLPPFAKNSAVSTSPPRSQPVIPPMAALEETLAPVSVPPREATRERASHRLPPAVVVVSVLFTAVVLLGGYGVRNLLSRAKSPWNAVMRSGHVTRIIASDPDISQVEALTRRQISVSDYANEQYGCEEVSLPNGVPCLAVFHGDKYAAVDVSLLDAIKDIAHRANVLPQIRAARTVRLPWLRTSEDYVLLGSARSNPWVQLFSDQMDFALTYSNEIQQEVVTNRAPRAGELKEYVPTARGFGTGESYATVSLLRNPNQTGHVLLLAGNSAEATQAAGDFINESDFADALRRCGIPDTSPSARYQVLLKVKTIAGSATRTSVLACHNLQ